MQLLDCSCALALDPWRSKKMKQLSAVSCQWCPIFLGCPVFFTGWNGWMIEASNQGWSLPVLRGVYNVVFVPGPERKFHWVEGENSFSMKNILQQTESLPLKTGLLPPKGKRSSSNHPFHGRAVSGRVYMIGLKLKTRQSKENPKFCRLGHLMKLPELGRSWKNVIGWNYPPTLDAIVTTRIMNHF